MDTDLLRTFLEVNETRHFGKAATNLYLTQSAVSFRIRQLEIQLGTPVFTRKRGDLRLTSAGERFVPYAKTILQMWVQARQDVSLTGKYQQLLSIGASNFIWDLDIKQIYIDGIQNAQPLWALRADTLHCQQFTHVLMDKQNDVILTTELPKLADIHYQKLMSFDLILVSNVDELSIEECINIPFVFLDWGGRLAVAQTQIKPLQRTPIYQPHSISSAIRYLQVKGGVGYLPLNFAASAIDSGTLYKVEDAPVISAEVFAVWLNTNEKHEILTLMFQELADQLHI